jgi:aspartate/tyrosine/aromatic aminotransferase
MADHLIPSRRGLPADDPIFALHGEAQARKAAGASVVDATVGALLDDSGQLVVLETAMALWRDLTALEVAPYAPIAGDPAYLRALVQRHWPMLREAGPACATPGGSGALAVSLRTFLEPGQALLTAAPFWGPYGTLASEAGVRLATAPWPEAGHPLDLAGWRREAETLLAAQGRLLVWLNDPCHNPTGRSLTAGDRAGLAALLTELAARGPVTLLLDLAYPDYTREPAEVAAALVDYAVLGEAGRVLVGASLSLSKALTLYGARSGALVFPWSGDGELQAALAMACRGLWSNGTRAAQSLVLHLVREGKAQAHLAAEHRHWSEVLESRALALDGALRAEGLAGAPWQGGFFVTLGVADPAGVCDRMKAEGVFSVPMPWGLRVGICGLRAADASRFAQALRKALAP